MKSAPAKKASKSGPKARTRTLHPSGRGSGHCKPLQGGLQGGRGQRANPASAKIANRAPVGTGPARSKSLTQRLEAWSRYREQYNPLRGLTLARAVSLMEDYKSGSMADLQWTYFHIEQVDADYLALIELGLSRLAEMDWDIVASEEADEAVAEAQSAYVREQFDLIDNLEEAIEHLAMARFRGFAHAEKITDAAGNLVHLEIVDQWNAVRDGLKGGWRYNPEARSTGFSGLPADQDMPLDRFLYRECKRHVGLIALFKFIRANLSEKDWDAFIEIYGVPSGVVIGPANVPTDKEAEFEAAAGGIAEGGSGYLPNGSQYIQNKAEAASTPFKGRLDHLSEKLVLAGTGGKLTMLTDATGLGSGASDAHSKVFDSIASAEAGRISRLITEQIVMPMLAARFPGQKRSVYFRLAANEETDTSAIIKDVVALSQFFDLDEAEVSERTGWKVTRKAAAPAAPGAPFLNRILNRDAGNAAAREQLFRAEAIRKLSAAQTAALRPLVARIVAVADETDDAKFDAALAKLRAELPALAKEVLKSDASELAKAWESILGPALVSAAGEAALQRK